MNEIDRLMDRRYQELGTEIVRLVVADYLDALIVKRKGYLEPSKWRKVVYSRAIMYGKRRYVRKTNGGLVTTSCSINQCALDMFKDDLYCTAQKVTAEKYINDCEKFFRSKHFAMYMPNTDPNLFIKLLKQKAMQGKRVKTGYPNIFY